jgi:hypothetical protein
MLVPAFLYGRYRDVKPACQRLVTRLRRGTPWHELGGDMIDTRERPGVLIIDGPASGLGQDDHFHVFAPARVIDQAIPHRLPESTFTELFEPMLATAWGFLALLGQNGQAFLYEPERQIRFLHALVKYWPALDAEGERYSTGGQHIDHLWQLATNIQFCLCNQGLPTERCDEPVPPGGMAELVAQTRAGMLH